MLEVFILSASVLFSAYDFKEVESFAFSGPTDALLIKQNGKILYEKYAPPYDADKRHYLWSISKSITGLLAAIADKKGILKIDETVSEIFPELKGKAYFDELKVRHLLEWSSGFYWREDYEYNPL